MSGDADEPPPIMIASRSLLRNMQEAFKGTTLLALFDMCDMLNITSRLSSQPKDEQLRAKAAQSL